jgi:DUF4097 and DUF4098 domain-containing protein YvlB
MNDASGSVSRVVDSVTRCHIELRDGSVTVEGTDGPDATLEIRTPSGGVVPEDALVVEEQDGELRIRPADSGRTGPRWLSVGRFARLAVRLTVPRTAAVTIESVGADVLIAGCRGGQVVSTVTGDAVIARAGGLVTVRTVSGSVDVAGTTLGVQASTTSGRMRIVAGTLEALQLRTVSGRLDVTGRLATGHDHRLESLSGDVSVTTPGGASLTARTISGRLIADTGARRELRHGMTVLTTGDGSTPVQVTTVSGDIRLGAAAAETRDEALGDPDAPDPVLAALEALARGDISIDEADRRLEVFHV